jgi:DNA (cytosine-5)-methyltransferase 1
MKVLDLFSGIGGFSLGLERAGMQTVGFCETDPYCRAVLRQHWPGVPIYKDVKELPHVSGVDVICGGFPCQPFSTAARGRNNAEDLWPWMLGVVFVLRPDWVIAENVPGIGPDGIERVRSDLEQAGYYAWTFNLDTAPRKRHRQRPRIFWLAYADSQGEPRQSEHAQMAGIRPLSGRGWENHSPPVGMDDGLPLRMDRLKALGNAVVPMAAEMIGRAILAAERSFTPQVGSSKT